MSVDRKIVVTPQAIAAIELANQRWKLGSISTLEAAIEQLRAMLADNPDAWSQALIDALDAYNDGDHWPLDELLGVITDPPDA